MLTFDNCLMECHPRRKPSSVQCGSKGVVLMISLRVRLFHLYSNQCRLRSYLGYFWRKHKYQDIAWHGWPLWDSSRTATQAAFLGSKTNAGLSHPVSVNLLYILAHLLPQLAKWMFYYEPIMLLYLFDHFILLNLSTMEFKTRKSGKIWFQVASEGPESVPEAPPAKEEFEQWTIPRASPNTEGWPGASSSPCDTSNHQILPKAPDQAQAQGHITRIPCVDLMLYENWEGLSSKKKKKRAIKLASRGLPIPNERGLISIVTDWEWFGATSIEQLNVLLRIPRFKNYQKRTNKHTSTKEILQIRKGMMSLCRKALKDFDFRSSQLCSFWCS